jgi:hypothetical protein
MARVTQTGPTTPQQKAEGCGWKTCKKNHNIVQTYINNGETVRKHLDSGWTPPWLEPKNTGGPFGPVPMYTFQRHHVIPVNVIRDLKDVGHNLTLIGWDINNYSLNGICLPDSNKDITRQDLPVHRGCHKNYDKRVKKVMERMHQEWKNLCDPHPNQDKLFEDVCKLSDQLQEKLRAQHPFYRLCFT